MRTLWVMIFLAAAGFFALFSPWTKNAIAFFPMMTAMAALLAIASLVLSRKQLGSTYAFKLMYIPAGIIAAGVLYLMFWVGHFISIHILPFAASQVDSIYTIRAGQNPWVIAGLLFFIIGPAEEVFWRGFVQRRLSKRYGPLVGLVTATVIYALVHLWSFNFMLLAASALCGAFWGLMFAMTEKLWPCIICHAVWDVTVFILLPIQ